MIAAGSRFGVLAVAILAACGTSPSNAEIDREYAAAIAANKAALAAAPSTNEPGFTLNVSGQIDKPSATLGWAELQRIGTTEVTTINVQNPDKKTPTTFRGVLVRDLLDRFTARPDATEATMVAVDGFRATVQIADARQFRMLLAIEADGAPIPRSSGGPIFLVHPFSENGPELRWKYPDRFWSFYVTHLVIGTEEPRLAIVHAGAKQVLERSMLERITSSTYDGPVSWKVEWTSGVVHLRGPSLVDALSAAGVALPNRGKVIVRGKAPLHSDPAKPIAFSVADLARCKPLLAMHWGPDEKPISARLGGPIAIAFTPCGEGYGDRAWVTFVDELEVVHE